MDIITQIEELRENIILQRFQALKNWESGGTEIDALIKNISEDEED